MLLDFFKAKPVLDEDSIEWIFDTFSWAERSLDATTFYQKSELILPSNEFFPGHSSQAAEMAQLIFDKVKQYSYLEHWPCRLIEQNSCQLETPELPYIEGNIRGEGVIDQSTGSEHFFPILYNSAQVKNPQAMIGYFAQTLASFLIVLAPNKPENYKENIGPLSEVVGVFMGFGLILANSAFNYKNVTCGSCRTPSNDRTSYLSQYDISYALAIFCVVKGIDKKRVLSNLKPNLRSFFKKAYKEVKNKEQIKQFQYYPKRDIMR
jgi:hypothetical protein